MKKMGNCGFVLMEAMVFVLIVLLFLISLFSSASFRNRTAILKLEKLEASYAANAAVELMAAEVLKTGTSSLERGMDRVETELIFQSDDGDKTITVPVTVWTERNGDELCLFAEVMVGNGRKTASIKMYLNPESMVATASESETATSSTAESEIWVITEQSGDKDE